MQSKKYTLNKEDGSKILWALFYSTASAIVGTLIVVIQNLEVDPQYMFLVPIVNGILYTLSKLLTGK